MIKGVTGNIWVAAVYVMLVNYYSHKCKTHKNRNM